ncbi:GNAT family N-acetyltransferase [Ideonella sp. A 288]|uniref:GNAT family N-acetyltransferase n=1 Tax=Ideonella sp. A 288 TaxID=1962181 RepID=UPI001F3E6CBC|nr:GNAT family N-acetyltransferase [Ideonella sp. A 288]
MPNTPNPALTADDRANGPVVGHSSPAAGAGTTAEAVQRLPWIPIRSLAPAHRDRILDHLHALSDRDRYLRFGYQANDEHLARYVDSLDFDRDEIFGVFNRRLEIVALAHLACPARDVAKLPAGPAGAVGAAEFGGSVVGRLRGRGYGGKLFEHAMLHARNRGFGTIFIHALSENAAMLRIARRAGATVERDGPESEAYLKLPPETMASHFEQVVAEGAAALDYRLKQHSQIVGAMVDAIAEVRSGVRSTARVDRD